MKKDIEPRDLIETIVNYDPDIWNNPVKWKKQEWHLFDLYLFYTGIGFFDRLSIKRKMRKSIRRSKNE